MEASVPNSPEPVRTQPPKSPPELEKTTATNHDAAAELKPVYEALRVLSEVVVSKLREPIPHKTRWEKFRSGFVQLAKDVGPLVTGLGSITVSIVVGLLTVTVTASVAFFNYQFNSKQAASTQMSLKTAALADFTEEDDGKRTLAAIKLAAYGTEALPAIKLALGVTHEGIRAGGVQAAEVMYQSRPDLRQTLLTEMLNSFQESNPTLRQGVLEFYISAAPQLQLNEKQILLDQLKPRLRACASEGDAFMRQAAVFLSKGPFTDATELLLQIARDCPHGSTNGEYEAARNQAVIMLPIVMKQQPTSKTLRNHVTETLINLKIDGSSEFNGNIDTVIREIQNLPDS